MNTTMMMMMITICNNFTNFTTMVTMNTCNDKIKPNDYHKDHQDGESEAI